MSSHSIYVQIGVSTPREISYVVHFVYRIGTVHIGPDIRGARRTHARIIEFAPELRARGVCDSHLYLTQRQLIDEVNRLLIYEGAPLRPPEIEEMITLIKDQKTPPLALDAPLEKVDEYIRARDDAYSKIIAAASRNLSVAQLSAFRAEFDFQLAYLKYFKMRRHGAAD